MDLSIKHKKLKKIVSDEAKLKKEFGHYANYVQARLDLLIQAKTLADVSHEPPPKRHKIKSKQGVYAFAVDVKTKSDALRIEFRVANEPPPLKEDGSLDFGAVTAIEISAISNHYE
jgi:hypothetical protein